MDGRWRILVFGPEGREAVRRLRAARPDVEWVAADRVDEVPPASFDAVFGAAIPPAVFARIDGVRWVQWWAAGVDNAVGVPDEAVLTRMAGVFTRDMAEYVLACVLDWVKGFPVARVQQAERRWSPYPVGTVAGLRVGIAGGGQVGAGVAQLLDQMGAEVTLLARRPRALPVAGAVFGADAVEAFLRGLSVLVLALPLTEATRGFLSRERLAVLPPGAVIINVGRGALIDEDALWEALESGHVAHAYLDVAWEEPLSPSSRWWTHPRVTITPHVAGPTRLAEAVNYSLVNLSRWEQGKPLRGVVDRARGY
jgi:glyoxylate/hydroxypyruvate reductase A